MLTAGQIAEETGIAIYTVRYRLSELRRTGKIKSTLFGVTHVYRSGVIDKVRKFRGK